MQTSMTIYLRLETVVSVLTVSNTFNIYITGRARKQKPYAFAYKTKQNKTNAILKTLYLKKVQQIRRIVANKLSYKYENSFTSWVKQINTTIRPKIAC